MRIIPAKQIEESVARLCVKACCELPRDVEEALERALRAEAPDSAAAGVLRQLIENERLAREKRRPICQDTGMAVVFADIGEEVFIEGSLACAVNEGVRRAYREAYLRKSVLSPLTRQNTGDNTPAVLHARFIPGGSLVLTVAPKGFGSENMSRVAMLTPAAGEAGILDFIVDTVCQAGASCCPPGVVGVGIGGTMELAALLAKRQLLRPIGIASDEAPAARLERAALERINATNIGPMGLRGRTTALAVHVGTYPTHIAGLPVAVNMQCHACRHATEVL